MLFEVLIWILLSANLLESVEGLAWYPLYGSWVICTISEIALFALLLPATGSFRYQPKNPSRYLSLTLQILRLALITSLLLLYSHHRAVSPLGDDDEESTALLHPVTKANDSPTSYGSVQTKPQQDKGAKDDNEADSTKAKVSIKAHHQQLETLKDWLQYVKGFGVFVQILKPLNGLRVQLSIFGIFFCLLVGRVLNVLLPRQFGVLIDSFSIASMDRAISFPGLQLGLFLLYRLLTSYKIMIEIESSVWLPFGNYAVRKIKSAAHKKVLALSYDFHNSRDAEEIAKVIDHGTIVTWLLRNFLMFLVPCVLDIIIFGIYLSCVFGIYMALLLCITLVLYVWVSTHSTTKRTTLQAEVLTVSKNEDQVL